MYASGRCVELPRLRECNTALVSRVRDSKTSTKSGVGQKAVIVIAAEAVVRLVRLAKLAVKLAEAESELESERITA